MLHRKKWPLAVNVALGALAGALYVAFDLISEARLRAGTLTGSLASAHSLIDHSIPVLAGALIGLSVYQNRLRARLAIAEESASRAEALRVRLQKVERDQAVWVLAAAVLHELNNPLHAIGLLLDEHQACRGNDAERDALVQRAHAQAQRALSHLETLRSMQTGEPETQRIALGSMIRALVSDVDPLAQAAGVTVQARCESEAYVLADPGYLRTILENLLDNSLHSLQGSQGGTVTLSLRTADKLVVVSVSDDGPELDENVRRTLFDPLGTTKSHGLGLGLPIARALARAMGGELALDANARKAFRLELPQEPAP